MEKRMNKEEILELVESLKVDKNEFFILSTSALVIRDLFSDAGDLDIAITEKGLEQLKVNFDLKPKGNGWYIVSDKIECIVDTMDDDKVEKYGDYYLQSLTKYFEFLEESNREKDKEKYKIIKKELEKRNIDK
ncbi:MAG: hypothetical protein E7157_04245 [Lactobacillales bacterium]|nr:hypothetical protein [Lactobacillales bacterium]